MRLKRPRSNIFPTLEIIRFAFSHDFHICRVYFVTHELQAELLAVRRAHLACHASPQAPAEVLFRHTCPCSGLLHLFPSHSACPRETAHRTGLGLSTPMGKLKPPLLQLGSRLWCRASNRAEPAGAGCLFLLPGLHAATDCGTKGTLRKIKK